MKATRFAITACATVVLGAGLLAGLAGCSGSNDSGKQLYESKCAGCHDLATVDKAKSQYKTVDDWKGVIANMKSMGADVSDADADAIAQYLAK